MRPVTQSRTGETGTCFRACIASLLGLKESQVPDWPEANQDSDVNKWLAKRGLRYEEVPNRGIHPAGDYIALGTSTRGGQHAVIASDGKLIHDPHPQDGTGRGLVKVSHWGLLLPAGAKDGIFTSRLDRYSMEQLLDTLGIDIKEFLRRTVDQRERLLDTAIKELDRRTGRAKDMRAKDSVIEKYRGFEIERGETGAVRVVGLGHRYAQYFKGWSEKSAVEAAKRAIDKELAKPTPQPVKPEDLIISLNDLPLRRKARDSDPRDGVTKCQACGVGLMGDDVLERGGKVICPECADSAVRKSAKDATLMNATPEQLRKRLAYLKAGGGPNTSNAVAQIKVIEKLLAGNSKPALDRSRLHRALDAVMDSCGARASDKDGDVKVIWTDHDYKKHETRFKNNPQGAPENALTRAKELMRRLETDQKARTIRLIQE